MINLFGLLNKLRPSARKNSEKSHQDIVDDLNRESKLSAMHRDVASRPFGDHFVNGPTVSTTTSNPYHR